MLPNFEAVGQSVGGWRAVASAWILAIMAVLLFTTADALATHKGPAREGLAGAMIPRHDPRFPGPDEIAASDWVEKARADSSGYW